MQRELDREQDSARVLLCARRPRSPASRALLAGGASSPGDGRAGAGCRHARIMQRRAGQAPAQAQAPLEAEREMAAAAPSRVLPPGAAAVCAITATACQMPVVHTSRRAAPPRAGRRGGPALRRWPQTLGGHRATTGPQGHSLARPAHGAGMNIICGDTEQALLSAAQGRDACSHRRADYFCARPGPTPRETPTARRPGLKRPPQPAQRRPRTTASILHLRTPAGCGWRNASAHSAGREWTAELARCGSGSSPARRGVPAHPTTPPRCRQNRAAPSASRQTHR